MTRDSDYGAELGVLLHMPTLSGITSASVQRWIGSEECVCRSSIASVLAHI